MPQEVMTRIEAASFNQPNQVQGAGPAQVAEANMQLRWELRRAEDRCAELLQAEAHVSQTTRERSAVALQRAFRRRKGKWRSMVLRDFATVVEAAVAQRKVLPLRNTSKMQRGRSARPPSPKGRSGRRSSRRQLGRMALSGFRQGDQEGLRGAPRAGWTAPFARRSCRVTPGLTASLGSRRPRAKAPTEVWTSPLRGFNDAQQRPRQVLASVKFAKEDVEQGLCNSLTNALAIRLVISMGDLSGPVLAALVQNCADGSLDKVVNFSRQTLRAVIEDFEGEPFLKKQLALFVHPDKTQHPCAKDAFQKLSM
eukprot:s1634_g10.t1